MSRTDLLAQSAFFAPLSEEEQSEVARRFSPHRYEKDDYLFWEGESAEWLVLVTEGQVKMIKHSESGRETIPVSYTHLRAHETAYTISDDRICW